MDTTARIYVAGHRGMVGSALVRQLQANGYHNLVTRPHGELDLIDQRAVATFFDAEKIDAVFLAAATVGGIYANNTRGADFLYENLMIQANVIHTAFQNGVRELLFLGSSCIYPAQCPQPMKEEHLLSGYLEPTNEPYAIAKIAGIKLCEAYNRQFGTRYRAVMPSNLYGPNDNFDLLRSHVLPAMIRKFHLAVLAAKGDQAAIRADAARYGPIPEDIRNGLNRRPPEVRLWGTGTPRREFLHVDDMAAACLFVMAMPDEAYRRACGRGGQPGETVSHLNVGCGRDLTLKALADIIAAVLGFDGKVVWDAAMPDGMMQKVMDVSRLDRAGWKAMIDLETGIRQIYRYYTQG